MIKAFELKKVKGSSLKSSGCGGGRVIREHALPLGIQGGPSYLLYKTNQIHLANVALDKAANLTGQTKV
jgi:hypothetical protein